MNRCLSVLIVVILAIGVFGLSCSSNVNSSISSSSPQSTTAQGIWPQGTYIATEVIWGKIVKATATFSGTTSLKLYDPVHGETLYSCRLFVDAMGTVHVNTIQLTNVATGEISIESLIYNPNAGTVVLDGPVAGATYFK